MSRTPAPAGRPPRVLFVSWAWPSHVRAMLPLGRALERAGACARFAVPPAVAGLVSEVGLLAVPTGPDVDTLDDFRALLVRSGPAPGEPAQPARQGPPRVFSILAAVARAMTSQLVAYAEDWRPDLVVFDPTALAGPVAAAAVGVPAVRHLYGPDLVYPARHELARIAADLAKTARVRRTPDVIGVATVDPCPDALHGPGAYRRLRCRLPAWCPPSPGTQPDAPRPKARTATPQDGHPARAVRQRVCVTWGETAARLDESAFRAGQVARAVAQDGSEVVAAVTESQRRLLGPLGSSVTVVTDAPAAGTLSGVDAVISHGGAATVITALAFGLPQVIVGQLPDHLAIGRKAAAAGAAICLPGPQASDDAVRAAVRTVLDDPSYAAAARAIQREYSSRPRPGSWLSH